jgi:hypothetical protein
VRMTSHLQALPGWSLLPVAHVIVAV